MNNVFLSLSLSESHMSSLRELSGTNLETPPTQNTATLVFLYLLTNICSGDQLKYTIVHTANVASLCVGI